MFQVLIVDDEPLARERLKRMLQQHPRFHYQAEAENGHQALAWLAENQTDLVLLDIHMPELDGMQTAERIAQLDSPPGVVFCTAYDDQALAAFKVSAIDYLLKPIHPDDLTRALNKASDYLAVRHQKQSQDKRQHVIAKSSMGIKRIDLETVYYFSADQKYVSVVHQAGEDLIDETLKQLEEDLTASFIRIHRSLLVANQQIKALEQTEEGLLLHLKDSEKTLPVSRRHAGDVRRFLTEKYG